MTDTNTTEPTGAQLVAKYNALVEHAIAFGLDGYRPVVRFTDRITADKRIAALESSIRARENIQHDNGATESPPAKFLDPRETGGCKTDTVIECHEPKCIALGRCAKKEKRVKAQKQVKAPKVKTAKAPKKTNGHGSKTAEVGRLLRRKNGCTTAEILEATGWTAVSVPAMAKHLDLRLRKEKEKGSVTRYFGE